MEKHNVAMLSEAVELFNCGAASESYGTVSSGNSFEKICLWLKPLNGQRFIAVSLSGGAAIVVDVPFEKYYCHLNGRRPQSSL